LQETTRRKSEVGEGKKKSPSAGSTLGGNTIPRGEGVILTEYLSRKGDELHEGKATGNKSYSGPPRQVNWEEGIDASNSVGGQRYIFAYISPQVKRLK